MAVAPQALEHRAAGPHRHPAAMLEFGEVSVADAREGLGDNPRRAGAYAVEVRQRAIGRPPLDLLVAALSHGPQSSLEGSNLGGGSEFAVQIVHGERQRH